jgi:hypothetical protein
VGQAIVIYSPAGAPQTTVPPNTNVSGTRGGSTATNQYPAGNAPAANPAAGNTPAAAQSPHVPGQSPQQVTNAGPLAGTPVPVAAGIIRLMSDRRPNADVSGATGTATRPNQTTQPQSTRQQQQATPTSPAQRQTQ